MPEEKLQYGFRKTPLNQPTIKKIISIPEEKLWNCDKTIVELKPITVVEEASEEEIVSEEDVRVEAPEYLGYADIGYGTAKFHEPKFTVHTVSSRTEAPCEDNELKVEVGDCGFKFGDVVDVTSNCGCQSVQATL